MRRPSLRSLTLLKGTALAVAILLGFASCGAVGFYVGRDDRLRSTVPDGIYNQTKGQPSEVGNSSLSNGSLDFSLFWKAWNIIDDRYYGERDGTDRLNGAIGGMVAGLGDPYTVYLPPVENKIFQSDLKGEFGGIGAELTVRNGAITVVASLEGTPAEKFGLKAQDVISEIDGTKTSDLSFNEAIDKIRGPKGSVVTLTVLRSGEEQPLELKITRDTIVVKSVKAEPVEIAPDVAYVKLNQFGQDTIAALQTALEAAVSGGKGGVIIDLRNNPGGYLEGAIDMLGMLLPNPVTSDKEPLAKRVAVIERSKDGSETQHQAARAAVIPSLPIVMLVNGGSASASEIVSGALKDYGRATLVGEKTFGKGSVQDLVDLGNGGSIKVTIAKWFTPLGTGIDGKGIEPDVAVSLTEGETASPTDTQAKKALEILRQRMAERQN